MLYARFTTSEGTFTARLFDEEVPNTVANFTGLAEGTKEWTDPRTGKKTNARYLDGTVFHRVIEGFMIQGGDPLGQGTGGPGYTFADEFSPKILCLLSSQDVGASVMKNWPPLVLGPRLAIDSRPARSWRSFGENSSANV